MTGPHVHPLSPDHSNRPMSSSLPIVPTSQSEAFNAQCELRELAIRKAVGRIVAAEELSLDALRPILTAFLLDYRP